jgi:hypothetical protein
MPAVFQNNHIDMLITDIKMRGMSGLEPLSLDELITAVKKGIEQLNIRCGSAVNSNSNHKITQKTENREQKADFWPASCTSNHGISCSTDASRGRKKGVEAPHSGSG